MVLHPSRDRKVESIINRYYDPATYQFLSIDPAVARTDQPYVFTNDNPLNATDPLGLISLNPCNWGHVCHGAQKAIDKLTSLVHRKGDMYVILEGASFIPYTVYYASNKALKWTNENHPLNQFVKAATNQIRPAAWLAQGGGLLGDAGIDLVKNGLLHNGEGIGDEGHRGPLFGTDTGFGGPRVQLPGIHQNGTVDWQW
jgi:hypothetical protein